MLRHHLLVLDYYFRCCSHRFHDTDVHGEEEETLTDISRYRRETVQMRSSDHRRQGGTFRGERSLLNPDCAVGIVMRQGKRVRDATLERFCDAGVFVKYIEEQNRETSVAAAFTKPQ